MPGSPILFEHEAPELEATSTNLDIPPESEEEEKAIKLVNHLFDKARKNRQKFDSRWIDFYKMFRGDQWKQKRPKYLHSECINFIFMHIQSAVPIMTDARPKPSFLPQNPLDIELAEIMNELFDADYQKGNWLLKIAETIFDGHFYGTGFGSLKWDPDAEFGLGRIVHDTEDPFNLYPDPEARDINDERYSHFIIDAEPRDVEKIRAKYSAHPFVNAIKPDLLDFSKRDEKAQLPIRPQFERLTDKNMPAESFGADPQLLTDKVMVITAYMKPADIVEERLENLDDQTGEVKVSFVAKKRYPKGRKLVMINNRIFEDGPLDNADIRLPYARYVNYIDPRQFFGISEVEQLESPQKIFNKLVSFALDTLTLMGNPIWVIPTSSGVKPGSFANAPATMIPYDGERAPERVEGAQLQPYVLQLIDRLQNWFTDISGSQDVSRGINPTGVTAASAIESLQEAAQTRTRQKMRNLDSYLVELGTQYVQLALQHYDAPRVFRMTDKDGAQKYFKFHVEPVMEEKRDPSGQLQIGPDGQPVYTQKYDEKGDPMKLAVVKGYHVDPQLNLTIEDPEEKRLLIRGGFDIKVNTESGLPFKKAEKEQRLLAFFDRQIIDAEEVLKQLEYPNYQAVLERVQAQQAEAAAQQQQGA
jgi:hypothetical protein